MDTQAGQTPTRQGVPDTLRRAVEGIEADERLDSLVQIMRQVAARVVNDRSRPLLRGDTIGHAAHPLLTDLPLGCWLSSGLLDVVGGRGSRRAAQRLVGLGLLMVPPTVATGVNDWSELREQRDRRVGVVHAVGNTMAAACYFLSWRARRKHHYVRGKVLGMTGGMLALGAGYLGGHLSFARGSGVGGRGLDAIETTDATDESTLLDLRAASDMLGVPPDQVREMVNQGVLTPVDATAIDLRFRDTEILAVRLSGA